LRKTIVERGRGTIADIRKGRGGGGETTVYTSGGEGERNYCGLRGVEETTKKLERERTTVEVGGGGVQWSNLCTCELYYVPFRFL
jgi:hypothetical protein